jgi:hypothetical protein
LRLVVPDRWGYKWVNKVSEIQAVNYDYLGFWESRGYSDSAIVGQDTGLNAPKPFPTPPTSTPSPIITSTPNASTAPTPTPSQNATTGGQATQSPTNQNPTQNSLLPTEALYAVSAGIIIAIAIIALVVHKKVRK